MAGAGLAAGRSERPAAASRHYLRIRGRSDICLAVDLGFADAQVVEAGTAVKAVVAGVAAEAIAEAAAEETIVVGAAVEDVGAGTGEAGAEDVVTVRTSVPTA